MSWEFPVMGLTQGMKVHRMDMTLCCIQAKIINSHAGGMEFKSKTSNQKFKYEAPMLPHTAILLKTPAGLKPCYFRMVYYTMVFFI